MFGWRKRIGYISPTVMEVLPYEFYRFAPEGVGLVGVTCMIDDWRPGGVREGPRAGEERGRLSWLAQRRLRHSRRRTARRRARARLRGDDRREISSAAGVPATTGVRSGMEALRAVRAERIVIASPYPPAHDEALSGYLKTFGFDVLAARGANLAVQGHSGADAARDLRFREARHRRQSEMRHGLSRLSAMAGCAGRRRNRAGHGQDGSRLHARQFLCGLQGDGRRLRHRGHGRLLASHGAASSRGA